jgi:hypothetical protein
MLNIEKYLLSLTLIFCFAQTPEVIYIINKYYLNNNIINISRLFLVIIYFIFNIKINCHKNNKLRFILVLFSINYLDNSVIDKNYIKALFYFFSNFACLDLFVGICLYYEKKINIWKIIGYFALFFGIIILLFDSNLNLSKIPYSINIYLIISIILLFKKDSIIKIIFLTIISFLAYFSENRTFIIMPILLVFHSIFFYKYKISILTLILSVCLVPLAIYYDSNQWFTHSILSGRSDIWKFWIDEVLNNNSYLIFGVGINSSDLIEIVSKGVYITGYDFIHQFHNMYISILVRGGIILLFTFLFITIYSKLSSRLNYYSESIFIILVLYFSFNTNFDLISTNIFGLIYIYSIYYKKN